MDHWGGEQSNAEIVLSNNRVMGVNISYIRALIAHEIYWMAICHKQRYFQPGKKSFSDMSGIRVKGPHNVGDFSGRSGRSPGPLLTYLGLYICSNAPKEGFPDIRQVFFD